MLIREYKKEDIKELNKLGLLLHENYEFTLDKFSYCNVIQLENEIIGFVIYSVIYERAEIVDIVINPSHRKKSYASLLLNNVINTLKQEGIENITLEVSETNNKAIGLYKKLGFKVVAKRKKYYNENDGYLMKKDLR